MKVLIEACLYPEIKSHVLIKPEKADEFEDLKDELDVLKKEYKALRFTRRLLCKDKGTQAFVLCILEAEQARIAANINALDAIICYLENN